MVTLKPDLCSKRCTLSFIKLLSGLTLNSLVRTAMGTVTIPVAVGTWGFSYENWDEECYDLKEFSRGILSSRVALTTCTHTPTSRQRIDNSDKSHCGTGMLTLCMSVAASVTIPTEIMATKPRPHAKG